MKQKMIPIHPASPEEEWHIAGVVVHANPPHMNRVRAVITEMTGAEVHAAGPTGKLVVTLEGPTSGAIAAQLTVLHQLEGVLGAALVYQHNEAATAMTEEIADENLAP